MSWDVVMIRTNTNNEAMDEIKDENIIPFKQAEIDEALKKYHQNLVSDTTEIILKAIIGRLVLALVKMMRLNVSY